ncbi:bifunctional pantoate--beta-alanine ligase/(d)CMP kinase [Vulcanococcus limneticus Candia 3F8]|nr:bifunctional pantoate--beta-alanine ligase/(d)CMP kinase [Vulcanococcus limneticus MW73D5]MCP9895177.1 bifunctional pantoate--beta-alanine ligase/(d)CMP kinase [Vulcanococcus limneticus Candia 3F8]MCP9898569.1 bifunctional pantoate--beta-alanine ligase/(d)CMP kinase [Vulcanococcus limneticus Candia 3B3]
MAGLKPAARPIRPKAGGFLFCRSRHGAVPSPALAPGVLPSRTVPTNHAPRGPVQLLQTRAELLRWRQAEPAPLHFVPTMGALHAGHAALVHRATQTASTGAGLPRVLVSVFVNPLQFGPGEDFNRYPRNLESDAALAASAGAAALFAPEPAELFPGGEAELTRLVPPDSLQRGLCGRQRPGHFNGVATVVARLLGLVRPQRLLLGEKDWQQLVILRRLVADLGLPVQVWGCGTVREADGLALSSRNRYLSPEQRAQAVALPRALARAREQAWGRPSANLEALSAEVAAELGQAGLVVDYVEAVDPHSLQPCPGLGRPVLLAAAAHCGPSRLIDHVFLMSRQPIVAIDGPAGAGKSTVTRAFAERLGLVYLDTGAMYRAVTWLVRQRGVDPGDATAVAPLLENLDLRLSTAAAGGQQVRINGQDVTEAIRSPEVTAQVSAVAAHGCVREALTRQQRVMGERGGLVAEGRDIGTAVFPDAELKVFLTATVAERARRRAKDLEQRGFPVPEHAELEAQIASRDHQDASRTVAPLTQAADAVELITDGLGIVAVVEQLVQLFRERVPEDAWPEPQA